METPHVTIVQRQKETVDFIGKQIQELETTRLELIPVLLESVEQVKSGEIEAREFDNSIGRVRVRLQKLNGMFNDIETSFQSMEVSSNVPEADKIEIKRASLSRFIQKTNQVPQ